MSKLLKTKKSEVDQIVEHANKEIPEKKKYDGLLIPSGSKMLNLACSDNIDGAFETGKIANVIGDSSSGKTLLALTMLARMANNSEFDAYDLILDDAEEALAFDIEELFGLTLDQRLILDTKSNTVEDFYGNVLRAISSEKPFVYVLDSLDSITSEAEIERSKEYEAQKKDKSGSYKTEKPRMISEILRVIKGKIRETNSFVLVISQTRDNIGFGAMFTPKVRTGGRALKFYCSHEIWLAVGKKKKSKTLEIGADVMAKVSKNKLTGKKREVNFPIYYDYGVDDLVSCIDFLLDQKVWKKDGRTIDTAGMFENMAMSKLIEIIEKENKEEEVFACAAKAWADRESSIKLNRKPKFM